MHLQSDYYIAFSVHFVLESKYQARAVMRSRDRLARLKDKETGNIMVSAMRALRIGIMHPWLDLGASDINTRSRFFDFSYDSLAGLRLTLMQRAGYKETISEEQQTLVMRELFLCMTLNPHIAIQFLRDSGVSYFFPGLVHISIAEWNDILEHPKLEFAVQENHRVVEKGENYLAAQIKASLMEINPSSF